MVNNRYIPFLYASLALFLDQVIKFTAVAFLAPVGTINLFGPVKLTFVQNTGSAFGLFKDGTFFLVALAVILVAVFIYYREKFADRYWKSVLFGLMLGAIIGNTADRIFRGFVVDYIDLTYWPVFNLADSILTVGITVLIVIEIFMGKNRK